MESAFKIQAGKIFSMWRSGDMVLEGIKEQQGDDSVVQRSASRVFLHLGLEAGAE